MTNGTRNERVAVLLLLFRVLFVCNASGQEMPIRFRVFDKTDGTGAESQLDLLTDRYGYLWMAGFSGLRRYDGYEFLEFPSDLADPCTPSHSFTSRLLEDRDGHIWVGTRSGLNRLDRATGCFDRFVHQPGQAGSLPDNDVMDLALDGTGRVVVVTGSAISYFDPVTVTFHPITNPGRALQHLVVTPSGLFAGGQDGLRNLDTPGTDCIPFADGKLRFVRTMSAREDSIWLGTQNGLYVWRPDYSSIRSVTTPGHPLHGLRINDILYQDGNLWVATLRRGLFQLTSRGEVVRHFTDEDGLPSNVVHTLHEGTDGQLWAGYDNGLLQFVRPVEIPVAFFPGSRLYGLTTDGGDGFYRYGRQFGLLRHPGPTSPGVPIGYPEIPGISSQHIVDLHTDRSGVLWILRGFYGMDRYDPVTQSFLPPITHGGLTDRRMIAFRQDAVDEGTYWIGARPGLGRYRPATGEIRWYEPDLDSLGLVDDAFTTLLPTPDGRLWLSCGDFFNDRIGYFDPPTERWHFLDYLAGSTDKVAGGLIHQLALHPNGEVWAATGQGLVRIDTTTLSVELITEVDGSKIGNPYSLIITPDGTVWYSTAERICRLDPVRRTLQKTSFAPLIQFSLQAGAQLSENLLVFGGGGGICVIDPAAKSPDVVFPSIVFNKLIVNGLPHFTESDIAAIDRLDLSPGERSLTLEFAALCYAPASRVRYGFRMEGEAWRTLGGNRSLSFPSLRPGTHRLEIRSTDGQSAWNPVARKLTIVVRPYWHETAWARTGFLLAGAGLLWLLIRGNVRRKMERQDLENMRQLDAFKSRFLTNLTHEFRTPLTLILGPARRLRERAATTRDATLGREARRIDRQGRRLLGLVDQLLSLRRLEEGQLAVHRSPTRLAAFVGDLVEGFHPGAAGHVLELVHEEGEGAGAILIDKHKVASIIVNLVTNALKYTPPGGRISLHLRQGRTEWALSVTDTGPGIPAEQQKRIFERFARVPGETATGTGIGLALVRELTELLGGAIRLESEPGKGSCFTVRFPLESTAETTPLPTHRANTVAAAPQPEQQDRPLLLIVEDEPDVRSYLVESLETHYRILTADDGVSGLELALAEIPDLIVSDVMMPGLDGFKLTARLKKDRRTSHVPVLLLTARTADAHRVSGLERGADAYLGKPFSERELHLRLRNLLTLRRELTEHLRGQLHGSPAARPAAITAEQDFIDRIREIVTCRLSDSGFSVGELERELGLSRSQLHRKLMATLGLSASKVIMQVRLEAAADRLRQTDLPIKAIAYDCGFADGSYFGKCFRERYGESPSAWRKR